MKFLYHILLIISLFLCISCKQEEPKILGSIYGSVIDKNTSKSIKNAGVELLPIGLKTVTGEDGLFEFPKVEEGTYNLYVTKSGYKEVKTDDVVVKGSKDKKQVDVHLEPLLPALKVVDEKGEEVNEFDFGYVEDDLARTFNIVNDGEETLNWQITKTVKWITEIKPKEGSLKAGLTQSVILVIERTLLSEGENETTIHITSSSGSKQIRVKASNYCLPITHIYPAENILYRQATLLGSIIEKGFPEYTSFGFVLSATQHPTLSNAIRKIIIPNKDIAQLEDNGKIKKTFDGLSNNTEYYARAYAINTKDTAYSNEISFSTLPSTIPRCSIEVVNKTAKTATTSSLIIDDGGENVELKGVCWSTEQNPTITGLHTSNGNDMGRFTSEITGLHPNTTYYIRAYARNKIGIGYSEQVSFQTADSLPTISTCPVINIYPNSATGGGEVISEGMSPVIMKGVCWSSTIAAPTIADSHTEDGGGMGSFISNINGLQKEILYYVRAYAINSNGISYGEQIQFRTISGLPTVSTKTPASTSNTIVTGGNASSDSRFPITNKGICYSKTNQNPTIDDDTNISSGGGNGSFIVTISSLEAGTTYYVRAYATNIYGTQYGESYTISTTYGQIEVYTNDISNITASSAIGGVSVTNLGGATLVSCGVCWGISQNPTIGNSYVEGGTQLGSYNCDITGLVPNTRYYVRAYASTNLGTTYGEQKEFRTLDGLPIVVTLQPTATANTINTGGVITFDGGFPILSRGICYSQTNMNPTISDNNIVEGFGSGTFNLTIQNLTRKTLYYVRAFATNSIGVSYGATDTITTKNGEVTATTQSVSNITANSALGGVNVSVSGGAVLQSCGICWATTSNPTINSSHIEGGTVPGSYSCPMSGLAPNTTYHVRAYAISDMGISYGFDQPFLTLPLSDYVDLGLPSGTKWRDHNESRQYGFNTYFSGGSVPSKVQWDELRYLCTWRWTGSGYMVTGLNGNYIILPAEGYEYDVHNYHGTSYGSGTRGYYWTSDEDVNNRNWGYTNGWAFVFTATSIGNALEDFTDLLSVRLVQ